MSVEQEQISITSKTRWPEKRALFGVQISETDYENAVNSIFESIACNQRGIVSCHAAHAVVTFSDSKHRDDVNRFEMITPDGQPVRWAMNLLFGSKLKERVYGPSLMLKICERAACDNQSIFLFGGSDSTLIDLENNLQAQFPELRISGSFAPPFRPLTEEEDLRVIEMIRESGAKIVFLGLGCPKQDIFAIHHRATIDAIQICVGAAFDFHAGIKAIAPQWMQRNGLEWVFRLYKEPTRLWKRYLITNSLFIWKFLWQFCGYCFNKEKVAE